MYFTNAPFPANRVLQYLGHMWYPKDSKTSIICAPHSRLFASVTIHTPTRLDTWLCWSSEIIISYIVCYNVMRGQVSCCVTSMYAKDIPKQARKCVSKGWLAHLYAWNQHPPHIVSTTFLINSSDGCRYVCMLQAKKEYFPHYIVFPARMIFDLEYCHVAL